MINLTREDAIKYMDEVVNEYGEAHLYEKKDDVDYGCRYVYDSEPDCLIAKILIRAGVPLDDLEPYEGSRVCAMVGCDVNFDSIPVLHTRSTGDTRPPVFAADQDVALALTMAQLAQDDNKTWGEARQEFRNYLSLVTT